MSSIAESVKDGEKRCEDCVNFFGHEFTIEDSCSLKDVAELRECFYGERFRWEKK